MDPIGRGIPDAVQGNRRVVKSNRLAERILTGGIALYLALTLALSAAFAYSPEDASVRRAFAPPPCAMRERLGIPCPLCFGTRTYIHVWQGHFGRALRLSPFVFGLFWVSLGAVPVLTWLTLSRRPASDWLGRVPNWVWIGSGVLIAVLFFLNWLYLIVTSPGTAGALPAQP